MTERPREHGVPRNVEKEAGPVAVLLSVLGLILKYGIHPESTGI
jgi:hypothetical protein